MFNKPAARCHFFVQLLFTLCLLLPVSASTASTTGDLITMKNGDIHNGRIAERTLRLQTQLGLLSIPVALTANIQFHSTGGLARLTTKFGERHLGTLENDTLTMARVLDPPLPLHASEIAEISIAARRSRQQRHPTPDTLETIAGDLFSGRILTSDFMLKNDTGIRLLNRADTHLIDINDSYDEGVLASVQLNDGGAIRGQIITQRIKLTDRYGNTIETDISAFSSIAFQVNPDGRAPSNNYRQRLSAPARLQDQLRDGSPGPELIMLRGGRFRRGDLQGDGDSDERNPQQIKVPPFAIGLYEITFDEYDRFCLASGHELPDDEGWGRGRRPAINVSWDSAVAYTQWLTRQTGQAYRLPSDAEWEYAARAGSSDRFWWGDQVGSGNANCAGCGSIWESEKSSPVGRFQPNAFGLHDTAGNVFEWVSDCWNDRFDTAPKDGSAHDKKGCGVRVIRGGAWSFPPKEVRSANRWRDFQSRRSDDTGFRIVRELKPE